MSNERKEARLGISFGRVPYAKMPEQIFAQSRAVIMSDMTKQEAWELDELLTKTTMEVSPTVEGPFIKHRNWTITTGNLTTSAIPVLKTNTQSPPPGLP